MRSISGMPSDELAGDAKRRVAIPERECLPMKWQETRSVACRYYCLGE